MHPDHGAVHHPGVQAQAGLGQRAERAGPVEVGYRMNRHGELAGWWVRAVDPEDPRLKILIRSVVTAVVLGVGLRRAVGASWLPVVLWVVGIAAFIASEFTAKTGEV